MSRLKNNRHRYDDALTRIDDREFERLLADFYRRQGWQVEHIGTGGTGRRFDGGVDLVLRRDDEVVLVQCKHWNVKQVPHNPVHELLGIMVNRGATGAILVTSGEFTRAAIDAATRNGHVRLINGHDLRDMLGELPEPAAPIGASRSRYRAANSRQEHGRSTRRPREVLIIKLVTAAIGLAIVFVAYFFLIAVTSKAGRDFQKSVTQPRPAVTRPAAMQKPSQSANRPSSTARTPVPVTVIRTLTPEESEAQRQRAAESLEIIKQTTPEWGAPRN